MFAGGINRCCLSVLGRGRIGSDAIRWVDGQSGEVYLMLFERKDQPHHHLVWFHGSQSTMDARDGFYLFCSLFSLYPAPTLLLVWWTVESELQGLMVSASREFAKQQSPCRVFPSLPCKSLSRGNCQKASDKSMVVRYFDESKLPEILPWWGNGYGSRRVLSFNFLGSRHI